MAMKSSTAKQIASDFVTPDLKRIRHFIVQAVTEGAVAVLVATIIALLTRMRDLMLFPALFPRVILAQVHDGRRLVSRTAGSASGAGAVAESEQPGGDASLRRAVRLARGSARAAGFS